MARTWYVTRASGFPECAGGTSAKAADRCHCTEIMKLVKKY